MKTCIKKLILFILLIIVFHAVKYVSGFESAVLLGIALIGCEIFELITYLKDRK